MEKINALITTVTAAIASILAWLTSRRKKRLEDYSTLFAKYQELFAQYVEQSNQMKTLLSENVAFRTELQELKVTNIRLVERINAMEIELKTLKK